MGKRHHSVRRLFALVIALIIAPTSAAEPSDAGKELSRLCQKCHGAEGVSKEPSIPKLAGQRPAYIAKQLFDFQVANRHSELMTPMSFAFSEMEEVRLIAAYFAGCAPMEGNGQGAGDIALGKRIFQNGIADKGVSACSGCHTKRSAAADATTTLIPVIAGQHKPYLVKQLLDFRSHRRSSDASGVMTKISKALNEREIHAVTAYISGL